MADGRDYLAGNGSNPLSKVAEHTLLKLSARVLALAAPIAVTMLWGELQDAKRMLHEMAVNQAVMIERIAVQERQIGDLRVKTGDRYTASQADQERRRTEKLMDEIRTRLRALETQGRG